MKPREPTADELKAIGDRVGQRVAALNRGTFLLGHLVGAELEGALVLLEAALRQRVSLVGLDASRADAALTCLLPDEW